jgi:2,3-bisphosphoglycerate-dependent phosphoglycerate mutase
MDLFLIRHGQSEADLLDVHEGRADFPLTELGRQQVKAMAEWMAGGYTLDRIYSSTLKRAMQTAACLAEACRLETIFEPELMERDNGLLAGIDHKEAERLYPRAEVLPVHRALYNMEPLLDFRCRAEKVLSRILEESNGLNAVAIVSHGGMINRLCHCLLRLPLESDAVFCTDDTGIHGWRLTEGRRSILFSNRTNHLQK